MDDTAIYYAHPEGEGRGEVELQWQAPNGFSGEIVFEYENVVSLCQVELNVQYFCRAKIAQDYDKFWVGVTSDPVEIVQDDVVASISSLISSAMRLNASANENQLPLLRADVVASISNLISSAMRLNASENQNQLPLLKAEVYNLLSTSSEVRLHWFICISLLNCNNSTS